MVVRATQIRDTREATRAQPRRFVMISGYHDFRSKRKANLHFIAAELAKRGSMFFLSLRFSALTRFREDPRHDLRTRANRVETVDGVDCYLWRTPIHPFGLPSWLALAERALFGAFASPSVMHGFNDDKLKC